MGQKKNRFSPIGKIIKKRLIDLNMTQQELAEKVGTSAPYLNFIIIGLRTGEKYIPLIEKVLDINLEPYKKSA